MFDMKDKKDYRVRLKKARKRRRGKDYERYLLPGALVLAGVILVGAVGIGIRNYISTGVGKATLSQTERLAIEASTSEALAASKAKAEEERIDSEKQAVVDSYNNLGIVQVSGYLNVREQPGTEADIIGKMQGDSACEILEETEDGWYRISSGGLEGYIDGQYVVTGEEARKLAYDLAVPRAIVQVDNLNIREQPTTQSNSVGQGLKNERYEVIGETDGWVQIPSGYMSKDYVQVEYALNEARKLDVKAMVFNMYNNMGISNVDNYLNVRAEPSEDGEIIGKMPSKAAGDILETTDNGWYKIQSGKITGYVSSQYILTGQAAKDEAMKEAELMAIVNTDRLNARTEPSTEARIWTQISNEERYPVINQLDGWVEIELDEDSTAFVSTDFVDVRYALSEAIKFSPLEEEANAEASFRTQVVNYALQFLGNPYVWGGTSLTNGADCSGFVMSVYAYFGISLPHYSGSQANMGRGIKSSEMRPGDLIFYANSSGTINHVAMYIGNGQVVHAASARSGIKISTWNYRTPVRIRNVIGD